MSTGADWLTWAREIQATAQTGLTFCTNPYDIERYHALRSLAARIMAAHCSTEAMHIETLFTREQGYATPKVGVRGAVFDADGRMLMVREVQDGRWTLPGGWAEVNQTASEAVLREIFEESGYEARVVKLAAVWDRVRQGHPPSPFSIFKLFFVCTLAGGTARTSSETSEVAWFAEDALPSEISLPRTLPHQLARMFEHWRQPDLPADFD